MNTTDDKTPETAATATGSGSPSKDEPVSAPDSAAAEKQIRESLIKSSGPVILFFLLGFAASLVVGWYIFPKLLYSQKRQPFNFNHALHIEVVTDECESCHFFRDDGSFSGVPKLEQCTGCHEEQQGESEDEKLFVTEYVSKQREVPWLVYARQPDCVFFSHAAHAKKAEMECVTCHGPISESEESRIYEENRITGYSRDI